MLLVDEDRDDDARYQANNGGENKHSNGHLALEGGARNQKRTQTGSDGDEQRLDENQDPQKELFHYGTPLGIR